jgi:hypothetical protein
MPAHFSAPAAGSATRVAPPSPPVDTLEDDDVSDLQATVMREMPALPPEVAKRLDAALGPPPARPLWTTTPMLNDPQATAHGVPASRHGVPPSMQQPPPSSGAGLGQTGPMPAVGAMPGGMPGAPMSNALGSPPTAPSPPMGFGAPYSQTPPSNPFPTQALPSWNSGHTAPLQPVPPLPGVNVPMPGTPMPPGLAPAPGYNPNDPNPASRPGFPSPGMNVNQQTPPGQWMQPPALPGAASLDTGNIDSDPFRQRGRGTTVAAVFALLLAAALTFAVVRYLL